METKKPKQEKKAVGKIEREKGYLYFVDGEGIVWETKMKRGGTKKDKF